MDGQFRDDPSTGEDRFAREDVRRYSAWFSAVVIVGLVIIGLHYLFLKVVS